MAIVKRTDYRASGAAAAPRSRDAFDHMSDNGRKDQAKHDKAVATLSRHAVLAAAKDLGSRRCWDYKDPEHRWSLGRLGALARRIDRERMTA